MKSHKIGKSGRSNTEFAKRVQRIPMTNNRKRCPTYFMSIFHMTAMVVSIQQSLISFRYNNAVTFWRSLIDDVTKWEKSVLMQKHTLIPGTYVTAWGRVNLGDTVTVIDGIIASMVYKYMNCATKFYQINCIWQYRNFDRINVIGKQKLLVSNACTTSDLYPQCLLKQLPPFAIRYAQMHLREMSELRLKFHCNRYPRVQLTIFPHWFK